MPIDGLSLVVGQGNGPYYRPDSVYAVVKLPPEPHTYKLVIGWRDRSNSGTPGMGGAQLGALTPAGEALTLTGILGRRDHPRHGFEAPKTPASGSP
jgi:hypothetical protein